MLRSAATINGYAIEASNGQLGDVSDFLFDDTSWSVRWLVVDTGNWLSGRKVLLPPMVLGSMDPIRSDFQVKLTKQQVRDSPDIDSERPVSRQMETNIYGYYGWSPYWGNGAFTDANGYVRRQRDRCTTFPRAVASRRARARWAAGRRRSPSAQHRGGHRQPYPRDRRRDRSHRGLPSGRFRLAHRLFPRQHEELLVNTRNWWPGKKVLISPQTVEEIYWSENRMYLNVDRQTVKDSPAYDPAMTMDLVYEKKIHNHYGYGGIRADAPGSPSGDAGNIG